MDEHVEQGFGDIYLFDPDVERDIGGYQYGNWYRYCVPWSDIADQYSYEFTMFPQ